MKFPLIWAWPLVIRPSMVGAEITSPSRTIANCCSVPTSAREMAVKASWPSPPTSRFTTQLTSFWGTPALAESRSDPLITERDNRYFVAGRSSSVPGLFSAGSQAISGLLGSSTVGTVTGASGATDAAVPSAACKVPSSVQVNWSNTWTTAGSGDWDHASSSSTAAVNFSSSTPGTSSSTGALSLGAGSEGDSSPEGLWSCFGSSVGSPVGSAARSKPTGGRWGLSGASGSSAVGSALGVSGFCGVCAPVPHGEKSLHATSRKRSWAWRLTTSSSSPALSPGTSTTIWLPPWVVTSASATPWPLTRWSMMLRASSRLPGWDRCSRSTGSACRPAGRDQGRVSSEPFSATRP